MDARAAACLNVTLKTLFYVASRNAQPSPQDGTRIKAVNNKDRNFTKNSLEKFIKAVDKRLNEYLRRLDESDVEETAPDGSPHKNPREKIEGPREKRER